MKMLFVYSMISASSKKPLDSPSQIHFGLSYLSSFLRQAGHATSLTILDKDRKKFGFDLLRTTIEAQRPDILCFTSVSTEYPFICKISALCRQHFPNLFQVIGGPHITLNPETVGEGQFDWICIGEGEEPLLELIEHLESGKDKRMVEIANIRAHFKPLHSTRPRPFIPNLDNLPFPDRDMWREFIDPRENYFYTILLGRGCPFNCTYCSNHALKKIAPGSYVRVRSVENVIAELHWMVENFGILRQVYFEIETILLDREWIFDLCLALEKFNSAVDQDITYGTNIRITPNLKDLGLFSAMKKANFSFINIGLESGSERIRKNILKRRYANEDINRVVEAAKRNGLKVCFYNMIGVPEETAEDFQETIKINRKCQPDWHFTSIFFPYPGTELYDYCLSKGYIYTRNTPEEERNHVVIRSQHQIKLRILLNYAMFDYYVYKGYRPIHLIAAKTLMNFINLSTTARYAMSTLLKSKPYKLLRQSLAARYRA